MKTIVIKKDKKLELFAKKMGRISGQGLAREASQSKAVTPTAVEKAGGRMFRLLPSRGDAAVAVRAAWYLKLRNDIEAAHEEALWAAKAAAWDYR